MSTIPSQTQSDAPSASGGGSLGYEGVKIILVDRRVRGVKLAPAKSSESAGDGAPEIEITPAMIEAGVEGLKREYTIDCSYSQACNLVRDILERALKASDSET